MASISPEQNTQPSPQLLLVGEKDKKRLLEVFVKRSLSLNEGSPCPRIREHRANKWVTIAEKQKRDRKHSSDTSLNLTSQTSDAEEDVREELFTKPESEKMVDTSSEKTLMKWKIKGSLRRKNGSDASQKSNSKPKKWFQREKGKEDDGHNHEASPFQINAVGDGHTKISNKLESSTEERKMDGSDASQKFNSKPKKWFQREKGKEDDHNHEASPFQTSLVGDGHTKISNKLESSTEERKIDGSDASQKFNSKPKKWFLREKGNEDDRHNHEASPFQIYGVGDGHTKMLNKLESSTEERKIRESKKAKKPTVWKSFLNWFSKGNQEKEQEVETAEESPPSSLPSSPQISCLPLHEKGDIGLRRSKSLKKRQSYRRSMKWRRSGDMSNVENGKVIEMVEPNNCYYEKVSEELEKIVHEVKDSPADGNAAFQPMGQNGVKRDYDEVIKRITEVIKQEGDFIDDKIKDNAVVSSFLESFSYRSFQQMADQYVQSEVPDKETQRPVAAPELVKFAFTLDFTARVANLHRLATGQIMGFGNQYLQDRFTHMSESHPHLNDTRTDGLKTENLDQDFPSI